MLYITPSIHSLVERALAEDVGSGDVTTDCLIPPDIRGLGTIVAKAPGVIAGLEVALEVFRRCDPSVEARVLMADGSQVAPGNVVAEVEGTIGGILKAERVALNFLQRLSAVATETSRYVKAVEGTGARILETRKTTPGLRELEKYAVRVGGGHNHRQGLSDGVLIKDNHIATLRSRGLTLEQIVRMARDRAPHTLRIEVEVETVEEAREALKAAPDAILLDNMSLEKMREAVTMVKGRCLLEASGGVNLSNVRAVAETGVDLISVGALTHSVRAMDISLDMR
ncbi:MAG: Nicotinate-nucleotide diphosphorylase (Carboxylating) [Dehalococcoidia bacterium]|nr:Nicotinate-nucleotide diphosphorylase (Carboxylating) [Dehalococcoidia bacterium]